MQCSNNVGLLAVKTHPFSKFPRHLCGYEELLLWIWSTLCLLHLLTSSLIYLSPLLCALWIWVEYRATQKRFLLYLLNWWIWGKFCRSRSSLKNKNQQILEYFAKKMLLSFNYWLKWSQLESQTELNSILSIWIWVTVLFYLMRKERWGIIIIKWWTHCAPVPTQLLGGMLRI